MPEHRRRRTILRTVITDGEAAKIIAHAASDGVTISDWLRDAAQQKIARERGRR